MIENLDRVIERDQKVTLSKERANSLVEKSHQYGSRTRQVRSAMRRRRYCYIAIGIGVTIVSELRIFYPSERLKIRSSLTLIKCFPICLGCDLNPAVLNLWNHFRLLRGGRLNTCVWKRQQVISKGYVA